MMGSNILGSSVLINQGNTENNPIKDDIFSHDNIINVSFVDFVISSIKSITFYVVKPPEATHQEWRKVPEWSKTVCSLH